MTLKRPADMSHARGLAGTPSRGHCATAAEGVVQRLLGEVEVAEQAEQGGEDAARVGAVDVVHQLERLVGRGLGSHAHPLALRADWSERWVVRRDTCRCTATRPSAVLVAAP